MLPKETENWDSFQARLSDFSLQDIDLIDNAYYLSKVGHRNQYREDGTRYFEHPRSVAIIILDKFKLKNPNLVIGALLHDVGEDSSILGNPSKYGNSGWRKRVYYTLTRWFNTEVAEMVLAVTKPFVDGIEITSKDQADNLAIQCIIEGSSNAKILKLSDRLHNIQTLCHIADPYRRIKKINETVDLYFPVFKLIEPDYPTIVRTSLEEMTKSMDQIIRSKY